MNTPDTARQTDHRLPFGKHKGEQPADVPTSYLQWALGNCRLSSGPRGAIADELRRRGVRPPAAPPPRPVRPCDRHPDAAPHLYWMQDRLGRRRIRAECGRCRQLLDHPPCVPPYTDLADSNTSATALLDALTRLDELGIELQSDGRKAWVNGADARRVPPELHALVRQQSHLLAGLIGKNLPGVPADGSPRP